MVVLQNGVVTLRQVKVKERPTVRVVETLLDAGDDVREDDFKVSLINNMVFGRAIIIMCHDYFC